MRAQGLVFCAGAVLVAGASVLGRLPSGLELWVALAAIVVFGVPHGALDPVLARQVRQWDGAGWAVFWLGYVLVAVAVAGVWVGAPGLFLAGFLAASAVHFGGDLGGVPLGVGQRCGSGRPARPALDPPPTPSGHPPHGGEGDGQRLGLGRVTPTWLRALFGGAVVLGPAWAHGAEVQGLFSALAGPEAAAAVMNVVGPLAGPWLGACVAAALCRARRDPLGAAELGCLALLVAAAPPLVGFATYFCLGHGARHVLRAGGAGMLRHAVAPMAGVAAGGGLAWWWMDGVPAEARAVQVVFVGLAALTAPHMALVWWWERGDGRAPGPYAVTEGSSR